MQYYVDENGGCPSAKPWAVVNSKSGVICGCHDSREGALGQLAQLMADEPKADDDTQSGLTPGAVGYY